MFRGNPCRTPHWIGIGVDICPLIFMTDVAFSYTIRIDPMNPASKTVNTQDGQEVCVRYPKKACLKFRDTTYSGRRVFSSYAIPYRIVATASNIVFRACRSTG
jgi:hypothetical protein